MAVHYPPHKSEKKRRLPMVIKILIAVFIGVPVLVGTAGFLMVIFYTPPYNGIIRGDNIPNDTAKASEYDIGGVSVSSVKLALGEERKVVSVRTTIPAGRVQKVIQFQVSGSEQNKDMSRYAAWLREHDGFVPLADLDFSGASGSCEMSRDAGDSGKEIYLRIDYDTNGYTLTFVKLETDTGRKTEQKQ